MSPHQSSVVPVHPQRTGPSAENVNRDARKDEETSPRLSGGKEMTKAPHGWWIFPAILCALVFWGTILFWLLL